MGLFDKLLGELVDIIEWVDEGGHLLVWRFPRYQNEIKQGAELIVRPGQKAVFVAQGKIADEFGPGRYTLKTENLPILSTLKGWKHGFNSPFRSEVYFFTTRTLTHMKWGTPNPIILRDPEYGPIRIRGFGNYSLKCLDPKVIIKELSGADQSYSTDDISELLRAIINTTFADIIGDGENSALEISAHQKDYSERLRIKVQQQIDDEFGLEIPQLQIVNISFPENVEQALDRRSSMGIIGNLADYQQFQMAEALTYGAGPGTASSGLELGLGMAMAQGFVNAQRQASSPPPLPGPDIVWHVAIDNKSQGPFKMEKINDMISSQSLQRDTLVWRKGMSEWGVAGDQPELKNLFMTPPPLK